MRKLYRDGGRCYWLIGDRHWLLRIAHLVGSGWRLIADTRRRSLNLAPLDLAGRVGLVERPRWSGSVWV
jgi:hypothetical protein